jgi:hypothetical protein
MTEDRTAFPVNLTKDEVQTILHALFECRILNTHTAQEQDLKPLSDRLKLRLEQRKKEMKNLQDLMEGPDLQVGI